MRTLHSVPLPPLSGFSLRTIQPIFFPIFFLFLVNALTSCWWTTEKQLMLKVAELIPKHHGRTKKQEPANTSTATVGPSKFGKGGKKKRWSNANYGCIASRKFVIMSEGYKITFEANFGVTEIFCNMTYPHLHPVALWLSSFIFFLSY